METNKANYDWQQKYKDMIGTAAAAIKLIKPGYTIFIGTGCAAPQHLINAMAECAGDIVDAHVVHLLTMGAAPYVEEKYRDRFKMNTFFVAENVRSALAHGIGEYTPIFLSEIPLEFEEGRIPIDIALITVSPPDARGQCSLGVSVDIVKSAAANAKFVIAQVNPQMPRTLGNSFIHVNQIDMLVPHEEPMLEAETPKLDERLRKIGENIAHLVEDGSTIECGIGHVSQAVAEFLRHKKDLGVHTELFSDWIIDLIECGAVTCAKKTVNRGKVVASFCMGSRKLYDYVDNNPFFEFHPSNYTNDPFVVAQNEDMIAINSAIEVDLTGQVCADSMGFDIFSGIGGQVDFIRGAARSKGGKPIIALPSTAKEGTISRIVPHLKEGAGVVTSRGDVHYVVTEYGVASLHGVPMRERCRRLIKVAHPDFREDLERCARARNLL
jgi:acyl-CoA hydrolase